MPVYRHVMSASVRNGAVCNPGLVVRFHNFDDENQKDLGECVLAQGDLKSTKGWNLLAKLIGKTPDTNVQVSEALEKADIDLTFAQMLVTAGIENVEDFPRWHLAC